MISIGNTIKTLRKAKGVTQEEVARELGVSYQAVSKYENAPWRLKDKPFNI